VAGILVLALNLACPALALLGSDDSSPFSLNTKALSGVQGNTPLPLTDNLLDCRPNPFNPTTTIEFEVASLTPVHLRIYDIQGRLVKTLVEGKQYRAGRHGVSWNGRDHRGRLAASGVYFYRLVTPGYSGTRTMTLVK